MKTKQSDILNIQTSAEENQNKENYLNNEIVHREQINNSPLWIVGNNEAGYFITLGKYRITERKNTIEEIRNELREDNWTLLVRIITTMIEMNENIKLKDI